MNDRLKTIVDLENYPIHDLSSSTMQKLIKKCKEDLDQFSCSTIPNFISELWSNKSEFKYPLSLSIKVLLG